MTLETLLTIFIPFIIVFVLVIIGAGYYSGYLNFRILRILKQRHPRAYAALHFGNGSMINPILGIRFMWNDEFYGDKELSHYKKKFKKASFLVLVSLAGILIVFVTIFILAYFMGYWD